MVTGAAQGIGSAIAQRLANDEWVVVGVDIQDRFESNAKSVFADVIVGDICHQATHNQAADRADRISSPPCLGQ